MQTATIIGMVGTQNLPTTITVVGSYTVPASTGAVISHLAFSNKTGTAVTVNFGIYNGSSVLYLAYQAPLAAYDTLVFADVDSRIVLATGQNIQALCSAASSVDVTMSVTQFT